VTVLGSPNEDTQIVVAASMGETNSQAQTHAGADAHSETPAQPNTPGNGSAGLNGSVKIETLGSNVAVAVSGRIDEKSNPAVSRPLKTPGDIDGEVDDSAFSHIDSHDGPAISGKIHANLNTTHLSQVR
jgi:hypothetical protein